MNTTKKQFNTAQKKLRKSSLSSSQKSSMLASIYNEVPAGATPSLAKPTRSKILPFSYIRLTRNTSLGLAVIGFFIITATLTSAKSLPGDTLYGVKTKVIEPIVSRVYVGKTAKQKYQERLIERRIKELQELQASGRLAEEARKDSVDEIISRINRDLDLDGDGEAEIKVLPNAHITDRDDEDPENGATDNNDRGERIERNDEDQQSEYTNDQNTESATKEPVEKTIEVKSPEVNAAVDVEIQSGLEKNSTPQKGNLVL